MNEIIKSGKFKLAAKIAGAFLVALVVFAAGVGVGLRKARFSYRFGENYERNFIGERGRGPMGMMREFSGRDFRNPHGLSGTIVSINDNNIVIKNPANQESTIAVSDKTIIKRQRDTIQIGDLKADDQIVVVGKPGDNGVVNADLIRVFNNNFSN